MRFILILCCQLISYFATATPFEETKNLPVSFQGRFRSLEPASKQWLHDTYHAQQLKKKHLSSFHTQSNSSLELIWKTHFMGHAFIEEAPLFWIHYAGLKQLLGLDTKETHFSYKQLSSALYNNQETNLRVMRTLLPYEFARAYHSQTNRSLSKKLELSTLAKGLWVKEQNGALVVSAAPNVAPWNFLKKGMPLTFAPLDLEKIETGEKWPAGEVLQLMQHLQSFLALSALPKDPNDRFDPSKQTGELLKMLPSRLYQGQWLSLHALDTWSQDNFTSFSDAHFAAIKSSYQHLTKTTKNYFSKTSVVDMSLITKELESAVHAFSEAIESAYLTLAATPYLEAAGKELSYPTPLQLKAETLYYRLPLIELALFAYGVALLLFLAGYTLKQGRLHQLAIGALLIGLSFHTIILTVRCFILQRPPVTNMFETVVYVPWIAMLVGLGLFCVMRQLAILIAATLASFGLLIVLKLTEVDARLENVQAVLDSQYWLIVHVLMIVGSYGVFIISGILGHAYLIAAASGREALPATKLLAKGVLQAMYIGVALLIPGTILGGVWAAESWGRFWDWDPKESWAFISACIYLLIIHAYTFRKIGNFGLAVGSVAGLMAISFTWYGVNYILGTGLHSYGFGKGGEGYYYSYLVAETLFLIITSCFYFLRGAPKKTS